MIFYWQKPVWERLLRLRAQLPHAVLLHGRPGMGKSQLAGEFAQALLCESPRPDGTACGQCLACGWFVQGNHPDFRLVQPDSMLEDPVDEDAPAKKEKKKSEQIRVEQVRALQGFLSVGTHRGGLRVIVLDPADTMNIVTQNALLKSLEEPPPGTLFMLITSRPAQLLPTVRSRCQELAVPAPAADTAINWLKEQGMAEPAMALAQSGGAPLAALKMAETAQAHAAFLDALQDAAADPLAMAQHFEGVEPATVIAWLQRWVLDIFRWRAAGSVQFHPGRRERIAQIAARADLARLGRYERDLTEARTLASHPLNARLFLEDLLMGYRAALQ